ncbi:23S rRNA (pseudouridine(1915)-N(3))-methyltransferase RlmH [Oceanithermus sp.]|uniref:23S rRNA (pseudouridine(1915)-N(3))-methyltransferase RlmH n=1 Tax=Oceanithermus sp. TaxID=2268145 RepID=UPI0025E24C27|nr:23S rRNA (pseudouridine(1915)-N(3))-methyltransferase RlmH [Oceanithermus sp.]
MRWRIVAVDKPKLRYAREGVAFYRERLGALTGVELLTVRPGPQAARRQLELSEGWFRVVLDERGELLRSLELARRIERWEGRGVGRVALLVGGAEGHADEVRAAADWLWSLSPLTLQHELALVVAMEQIYRAYMIKRGSPYHRE